MGSSARAVKAWRRRLKLKIVMAMGGKCAACGYNKSASALDLHHLDPNEKEFSFSRVRTSPKSWDAIVAEMRKCVLLCANCHREVHAGDRILSENLPSFNEDFSVWTPDMEFEHLPEERAVCPVCGGVRSQVNKVCSRRCSATLKHTIQWDSVDLIAEVENSGIQATSEKLGCSYIAVVKRLKKINGRNCTLAPEAGPVN